MVHNRYPGKIILFGEYTVINGGQVLAVPLTSVHGGWVPGKGTPDPRLMAFIDYLQDRKMAFRSKLDLERIKQEFRRGLYFHSNIPVGYGAGSSGALVAGLVDRYLLSEIQFTVQDIKDFFASLESFFHGSSSGIDPLVSFFKVPLRISSQDGLEFLNDFHTFRSPRFYLWDSGQPKNTKTFVEIFKRQLKDSSYLKQVHLLADYVDQAISVLIHPSLGEKLDAIMKILSAIQWDIFQPMIPDSLKDIWKKGLQTDDYYIKLCGSGGGGYFLVYVINEDKISFPLLAI